MRRHVLPVSPVLWGGLTVRFWCPIRCGVLYRRKQLACIAPRVFGFPRCPPGLVEERGLLRGFRLLPLLLFFEASIVLRHDVVGLEP